MQREVKGEKARKKLPCAGEDIDVSICIVNFNTRDELDGCIASLERGASLITFEVIVVDNASIDGSPHMVRTKYPWVKLIVNERNIGFAAGCNQAMLHSSGRYIMLLNPDTVVHDGAIEKLVRFMDEHPGVAIVGPKLLNPDGTLQYSCRAFPTLLTGLFRNTPLERLFPSNKPTKEYLLKNHSHEEPMEVDWLSGAAMLVRRDAIRTVGMLDEGYFMYCEDVDWCWRMRKAGFKVFYVPSAIVTHAIGKSSDQLFVPMLIHRHRSMLRFYFKNYRRMLPLIFAPLIVLGIGIRLFGALSKVALSRIMLKWRHWIENAFRRKRQTQ
ncbi:MAG: glycosyltransferase family 2 protein [Armatimonadota bacterium]|nr:glycosyltransferase family 2 protein [Armatimonadota bacterium]MCX7777179.1 glycosyltransferase family 2 protein [Armatimonadota bacterium]MDW8025006.1 glycosyltransferase family 2 protein [Armatimonadota bacterium]